jgi:hypothetical protein
MDGFKQFLFRSEGGFQDSEIINFYNSGRKITEIARLAGRSVGEIYRVLQNFEIKPNRLNLAKQHVIDYAGSGYSVPQIAELTGYTPRNVRYILAKLKME